MFSDFVFTLFVLYFKFALFLILKLNIIITTKNTETSKIKQNPTNG